MAYNTGYKVEFANGSIKDLAGNGYTGTTSYNFKTANQSLSPITADLITTAANLAARAYQDEHYAANEQNVNPVNAAVSGWSLLDRTSLGYDSGDTHLNSYANGHLLRYDNGNASATVGLALLNGKRTLGLSFEGTNFPLDDQRLDLWDDIVSLDNHAAKLSDFMQRVATYAEENAIEQVLVTGHSLGGAMAQEFMSRYGSNSRYVGVTFGSPGTPDPNAISGDRMLNIVHEDDLVPFIGQHGVSVANTALTIQKVVEIVSDAIKLASLATPASVAAFALDYFIDALAGEELEAVAYTAIGNYFGMSAAQAKAGIDAALARDDYQVEGSVMSVNLVHQDERPLDFWWLDEHAMFFSSTANPDVAYEATVDLLLDSYSDPELFADLDFLIGTSANDDLWSITAYDGVLGGSGNDTIHGSILADRIICGPGNDTVLGGPDINGNDVCVYPGGFSDYQWTRMGGVLTGYYYQVVDMNSSNGNEGADKLYAIEQLVFDDAFFNLIYPIFGIVADGYIAGAALYIDTDADGIAEPDENTGAVTDAHGNFSLETTLSGALIAIGGTNIDTGLPNTMQLSAPEGSSVVSPLTTLVQQTATQQGISATDAETRVQTALGISANVDLTQYDPLAQAAGNADALAVQQVAAQVATLATLAPEGGTTFASIAASLGGAGGQTLDLTDAAVLQGILPNASSVVLGQIAATNQVLSDATSLAEISTIQQNALGDTLAPTVTTFSPADEASNVAVGSNIVVTFSEAIAKGVGNIVLKTTAGVTVATYDAASSGNLSIAGAVLTINPTADLSNNTGYKIEFAAGTIKDLAGNPYAGSTDYNFTTAATPPSYTVPGTRGNDYFIPSAGNNYLGGGGNDTYVISPFTLTGAVTAKITDTEGSNVVQWVDGMTISTGSFYADAAQLTLSNGAKLQILGASKFSYQLGANAPAGDGATPQTYAQFAAALGVSLPTGATPVSMSASHVVATGLGAAAAPTPATAGPSYTVPGTLGNDFFIPSGGNNHLGGGGNDTYIISPYTLSGAVTAKITDTEGANVIQLVDGLTIASSSFYGNAAQLTLSNGASVQILGAAAFSYQVGANAPAGDTASNQTYAQFASTLGASLPTGSTPVNGMVNYQVPTGTSAAIQMADAGSTSTGVVVSLVGVDGINATLESGMLII